MITQNKIKLQKKLIKFHTRSGMKMWFQGIKRINNAKNRQV
jgi:hypothetical protein